MQCPACSRPRTIPVLHEAGIWPAEVPEGEPLSWGYGAAPDEVRSISQWYVEAGGNFIDPADNYQHGEAERLIGELMAHHRIDLIIASKFSRGAGPNPALARLASNRKAMVQAVEESLVRLKTDRSTSISCTWTTA